MWTVTRALADWYDAVELWVTQLAFPLQVLLAVVVVLPLCLMVAVVLDRVSERLVGGR
ncbi:hypothetical protein GCM10010210_24030 [Pseudonocardia hydrocarbonoxydans]|uniref:Uncharacterized protein n=1 Tax=Pseudonocardia hydrocarbonoxydans TaxID=76726 RepID=A0A4Y3WNP2_9PSEU|nr:hypothetical protein PHY01_17620 [Pseudonocardia hydrocarbonoxydans]